MKALEELPSRKYSDSTFTSACVLDWWCSKYPRPMLYESLQNPNNIAKNHAGRPVNTNK